MPILTDESCNYKFYESCGCEKVYETIVENWEYGKLGNISKEKAFIYEKPGAISSSIFWASVEF